MIEIIQGDLLESSENLILHQVNCQGKMNSGIALLIKEKHPKAFEDYISKYNSEIFTINLLGEIYVSPVSNEQHIVHMFSQFNYGYDGKRYTDYEAIYKCLERVSSIAKTKGLSVALPYNMGCDRGGANWNIVRAMIDELFKDIKVKIYKLK